MFKNIFTFAAGAAVGVAVYHLVTKTTEVIVDTVVETVVG